MRFLLGLFFIGLIVSCCQNKSQEKKTSHSLKEFKPMFENEEIFENEIKLINSDKKLTEVTSLEYLNNSGESFIVKGLVTIKNETQEMTLKKLTFKKISSNGNETTCDYYYIGSRKFASSCHQTFLKGGHLKDFTIKSYYNDSSAVFFSKKVFGEPKENQFAKCELFDHDDKLALKIINQEDDFETKFQGFTENMGKNYLILGTDNYTTTVAFSQYNPTLTRIKNNEKKYLGTKLMVDFFVQSEASGFTFQALKDVRFAP